MTAGQADAVALCALADLPEPGSAAAVAEVNGIRRAIMLIRQGDRVFAYVNSCPHTEGPLDFTPGQFLSLDRTHILCSSHGAEFRIDDGYCVSGPCQGKSLQPVAVRIEGAHVVLDTRPPG